MPLTIEKTDGRITVQRPSNEELVRLAEDIPFEEKIHLSVLGTDATFCGIETEKEVFEDQSMSLSDASCAHCIVYLFKDPTKASNDLVLALDEDHPRFGKGSLA